MINRLFDKLLVVITICILFVLDSFSYSSNIIYLGQFDINLVCKTFCKTEYLEFFYLYPYNITHSIALIEFHGYIGDPWTQPHCSDCNYVLVGFFDNNLSKDIYSVAIFYKGSDTLLKGVFIFKYDNKSFALLSPYGSIATAIFNTTYFNYKNFKVYANSNYIRFANWYHIDPHYPDSVIYGLNSDLLAVGVQAVTWSWDTYHFIVFFNLTSGDILNENNQYILINLQNYKYISHFHNSSYFYLVDSNDNIIMVNLYNLSVLNSFVLFLDNVKFSNYKYHIYVLNNVTIFTLYNDSSNKTYFILFNPDMSILSAFAVNNSMIQGYYIIDYINNHLILTNITHIFLIDTIHKKLISYKINSSKCSHFSSFSVNPFQKLLSLSLYNLGSSNREFIFAIIKYDKLYYIEDKICTNNSDLCVIKEFENSISNLDFSLIQLQNTNVHTIDITKSPYNTITSNPYIEDYIDFQFLSSSIGIKEIILLKLLLTILPDNIIVW